MSGNAERNDSETMITKEMEGELEEMRQELSGMGMYEPGYTYNDMKAILGVISESKDMAKMNNDNKVMQKEVRHSSSDCTLEMTQKVNLSEDTEAQEHAELHRTSYLHRTNCTSPTTIDRKSRNLSSPDSMCMFEAKNSVHRLKNSDTDDVFENTSMRDACSPNANKYLSLRSSNLPQSSQTSPMDMQSEYNQKLERWRINPFDSVNETDVPLQQPDRPPAQERVPFRYCKDAQTAEKAEKVMAEVGLHLKEMSDLWCRWHNVQSSSKFQWGSPIQVGTANGSLDKRLPAERNDETTEKSARDLRASKRAANLQLNKLAMSSDSDEDDKTDVASVKRKKTESRNTHSISRTPSCSEKQIRADKSASAPTRNEGQSKRIDFFESSDSDSSVSQDEKRLKMSPEIGSMRRPRLKLKKPNQGKQSAQNTPAKTTMMVDNKNEASETPQDTPASNKKINARVIKDSNDEEADTDAPAKQNVEIKPLPMKFLSVRLERQYSLLKMAYEQKKKQSAAQQELEQKKEEEERKKREERAKQQLKEMQEKRRQEIEAQRREEEKTNKWNDILKSRVRTPKSSEEANRRSPREEQNRLSEMLDQIEDTSASNAVNCPICNKSFASDKIETHAAECEQYENSDEEITGSASLFERTPREREFSRTSKEIFECDICSSFKTTNGTDYEEHVNKCLQSKYQSEQAQSTEIDIRNVPTSPVRTYVPISKQRNSSIDYKAQFPTNSKAQVRQTKKRKR